MLGSHNCSYLDQLDDERFKLQEHAAVHFADGEIDRIYIDVPRELSIECNQQTLAKLLLTGFRDAVVWNPHIQKSRGMADLPDDAWKTFLCVEPAVAAKPIVLTPGAAWSACLRIE